MSPWKAECRPTPPARPPALVAPPPSNSTNTLVAPAAPPEALTNVSFPDFLTVEEGQMTVVVDNLSMRLPLWAWVCVLLAALVALSVCIFFVCRCCCRDALQKSREATDSSKRAILQRQATSGSGLVFPNLDNVRAGASSRVASQRVASERSGPSQRSGKSQRVHDKSPSTGGSSKNYSKNYTDMNRGFDMVEVRPARKPSLRETGFMAHVPPGGGSQVHLGGANAPSQKNETHSNVHKMCYAQL